MSKDIFSEKFQKEMPGAEWLISEDRYEEAENLKFETLFALSNGYLGIRGSHEEGTRVTLPYLYINGVFDKSETFMRELCALPNWLGIRLYVEKELLSVECCEILEYSRVLDMKKAVLYKHLLLRDKKGRETLIEGRRFVSRRNVHRMGISLTITPMNYSGLMEVESLIDGTVINFYDAPRFKVKHTVMTANEPLGDDGIYHEVKTRDNGLHVGTGCRIEAYRDGKGILKNRRFSAFGETALEFADFAVEEGKSTELVKFVSMYTERECEKTLLKKQVAEETEAFRQQGFDQELSQHAGVYEEMWKAADIRIKGDPELDRAVRFNIFHLMSTGNEHDDRVNVGAKLLSGEEYGGHAFWDTELFMLPFFAYVFPETAKNLENYRYHLLPAAKENAKKNGYQGAQYPWESADDGTEQCPDWTIEPDGTCYRCYVAVYEHHVTAAVAYGIYNYARITGDMEFLYGKGAEILTETARFWASRCQWIPEHDRYEIRQVTGPDEWHEPVDNNLYTNYLAKWNLRYVIGLLSRLSEQAPEKYRELVEKTGLTEKEVENWQQVQEKIYLPRKADSDILEQFEGYFDLEEVLIEEYDENDWPIRPKALDHMKKGETQILKQADVVMLLHLLGNEFDEKTIADNYHYYEKRTLHGSSLSPSIYSIMGLRVGDSGKAYRYLKRAALLDLLNLQKNTREGIHAANTGGVWQTVVFGFAGVSEDQEGALHLDPRLPKEWEGLEFGLTFRGRRLAIRIDGEDQGEVTRLSGEPMKVWINGREKEI